MDKKIMLGTDSFDKLIEGNGYYVDKTELIFELAGEAANEVTLFTRPRRFGKSLTMSMIGSFFDIQNEGSRAFDGLNVQRNHPDFCRDFMHRYPTISISLKDVEALNYETAYKKLKTVIADLCKKLDWLPRERGVNPADAEIFDRLMFKAADEDEVQNSLKTVMRMLNAAYGKPAILLIDEYDVPLAKAHENHFYPQMLDVIRGIMSTSLKSNEYLKFAVVTGCLRIPKESIFTGVNNFSSYSVLDEDFSGYFGFTEEEVKELLRYLDREEKLELIQKWYDGYVFGNTGIYCPWDVMSYAADLRKRRDALPRPYWENSSGNSAIRAFFEMKSDDIASQFETLLNGGAITENVTNALTYEEAYSSVSNLWSVLLMTGYVTSAGRGEERIVGEEATRAVDLRIPNREISMVFQRAVTDRFNQTVDQSRISDLIDSLWNGEEERASKILSDLLFETISYMDYHEDYYHAFIAGVFAGHGYSPQTNKEHGLGRPDIDLRDRRNRRMMVIECKKSDSKERMAYWCDRAIGQINERNYTGKTDGFNEVLCYGISFFEKSALVKRGR